MKEGLPTFLLESLGIEALFCSLVEKWLFATNKAPFTKKIRFIYQKNIDEFDFLL